MYFRAWSCSVLFCLLCVGHTFGDIADVSLLNSGEVLNVLLNDVKYFLADQGIHAPRFSNNNYFLFL